MLLCAHLILITSGFSALAAPSELERYKDPNTCEVLLRNDNRQELRNIFVKSYGSKVYASELENSDWIKRIYIESSRPKFYVAVKNSALKALNDDIVRDKDLVTALTNLHKEIFLRNLSEHLPKDIFRHYSDFKSIRLEILESPNENLIALIEELFLKTNAEFYSDPVLNVILRKEDLVAGGWFTIGTGLSEGEAAMAARAARRTQSRIMRFSDSNFQAQMSQNLMRIKLLHSQISQKMDLSLDVYIHCRKTKEPRQLLQSLREEFPQADLDLSLAEQLVTFCAVVDEFSPSLLTAGREILTLEHAPYGVMALDFIGLGAENLKATAETLLIANNLNEALYLTRLGERDVTEKFIARKSKVKEVVSDHFDKKVSIRFSGDDAIILPEREVSLQDQLFLLKKLSSIMPYPFFRMSTIYSTSRQVDASVKMISQAEAIEKTLRPLIRKNLGSIIAKGIHINVFNTKVGDDQKVFLVLKVSVKLSLSQIQTLYSIFEQAVSVIEDEINSQGSSDVTISTGDIFSI